MSIALSIFFYLGKIDLKSIPITVYSRMPIKHSYSHHAAYRNPTEDRVSIHETKKGYNIYSVFDGHSGQRCVDLVNKMLPIRIQYALEEKDFSSPEEIANLLTTEFEKMERECSQTLNVWDGGTTAVVSVVSETHIITAHLGDSPALLMSKEGELLQSTKDHDSRNTVEVERVNQEGGWFSDANEYGENRLYGSISVTRCFGNKAKKENERGLSAIPEIDIWERKPNTYLILCSDSFTEKIVDAKGGVHEKIIANRGTHAEIASEIHTVLQESDFDIGFAAPLAVHKRTMKFYNWEYGMYSGDNTSLILVELE
jgi:serine/threonine protein phosphatase PrpC